MTIYLDVQLPAHSSDYGERDGQPLNAPISILLRVGFTWTPYVTIGAVSSCLAFPSLPAFAGGLFLLHFPWSRLHRMLSGTLSYGARTFLTNYYMVRSLVLLKIFTRKELTERVSFRRFHIQRRHFLRQPCAQSPMRGTCGSLRRFRRRPLQRDWVRTP